MLNFEFLNWLMGLAANSLIVTVPVYWITSTVIINVVKRKNNILIFAVNIVVLMVIMRLLNSFTIDNAIVMFLEALILTWITSTPRFTRKNQKIEQNRTK